MTTTQKSFDERYNRAKEIISSHDEKEKIMIKGGCMAYLDAFSDYDNPLLHEMNKAEMILQKIME